MVIIEEIESLLQEFSHELYLYPWELFELRIQEEMVRADRSGSGFGYMEITFAEMRSIVADSVPHKVLWRYVIQYLAETLRGSDIKGLLADFAGFGVVLLDSGDMGAVDCRNRLLDQLQKAKWLKPDVPAETFKVTHYPLRGES